MCLAQIHLKNRELENTKLSAELQMLKSVDVNKENTIAQLKEELTRVKSCLAEKEKQHRQLLANSSPSVQTQKASTLCAAGMNPKTWKLSYNFSTSDSIVPKLLDFGLIPEIRSVLKTKSHCVCARTLANYSACRF